MHLITAKKANAVRLHELILKQYSHSTRNLYISSSRTFNPSGHAAQGVGLQPLACWDCGFESCEGHEYLSLLSVVCCQVEASATGRSLIQSSPTKCVCVSLSVIKWKNNLCTYNE